MKIAMFSMTPLFPNQSMGGAQKQLKKVALYLGEQGHDVTILCTRRQDTLQPFQWGERVRVVPTFRFKQPFPEPYATEVYNIAAAVQEMGETLAQSDRFYNHDGGLIFPYIYGDIRAVISLRSILFSETLQSGFLFQGDALILPSEHTALCYQYTVGRFFPEFRDRVRVIHNGLDWNTVKPMLPNRILSLLPPGTLEHPLILYPHRPEGDKGIFDAIELADRLVHQYKLPQIRVLMPKWIDTKLSPEVRGFYDGLAEQIDERGLKDNFIFHDWISDDLIEEYYSIGTLTLCLGSYVETFGNVVYESLGCGTPVIAARVGPHRTTLPDALADKIDYGDLDSAAAIAANIIAQKRRVSPEAMSLLHEQFSLSGMVTAYAETILSDEKRDLMPYRLIPIDDSSRFILPPWCYRTGRGIYNDFRANYTTLPPLDELFTRRPDGFTFADAAAIGIEQTTVMDWYRDGLAVPELIP
ncbi:MAG: glycosyltransferase family 4 protein [Anaerolineae bacterium]|nr:glycosyltransferase family 4 protein [Anaerolineae bacterium]